MLDVLRVDGLAVVLHDLDRVVAVTNRALIERSLDAIVCRTFARLWRSDLRPRDTRHLIMTRPGDALLEIDDPRVMALLVLGANPVASNPDQMKVRRGLAREDLFTVVIEHFQTDTADYADLLLPTTMQPEHADLHKAYGHLYLMWNEPAVPPPGECLPSTEIFRRLARQMSLNDPCLYASDEDLAQDLLDTDHPSVKGITLERLKTRAGRA